MQEKLSATFADSKPHYELLDGLRGVAALIVIWFHIFEAFATSPLDQKVNHGYLAVDFFFILSGFVIGYAYDDRWKTTLTTKNFFRRRLIRLHPMVILGVVLGTVTYCIQGCVKWDGTHVTISLLMLAVLFNLFMLPVLPGAGADVRGNNEMFPLNGPNWSLFFEYIGNILYALFLRRLRTRTLTALVVFFGICLASFAVLNLSGYGHLGVGWSLVDHNLAGGLLRMLFSFSAGLLLSRKFKPRPIRGAFWICSFSLAILLSLPHMATDSNLWLNGLYDTVCVLIVFPILVYIGAAGRATDKKTAWLCNFLGDISYPVYVVHYPFAYLFYAWTWSGPHKLTFAQAWPLALTLFFGSIILAYACLKIYDEPVRRWLSHKFMSSK